MCSHMGINSIDIEKLATQYAPVNHIEIFRQITGFVQTNINFEILSIFEKFQKILVFNMLNYFLNKF